MLSFALITEGITDQVVIESILIGFYRGNADAEIDVNPLQPPRDATDEARAGDWGGWEAVLELCSNRERVLEALALNDFVVIHLDTDCAEHPNFNVSLTDRGVEKSVREIIGSVKEKLIASMGIEIYEPNKEKLIFAISVHSMECWLLPLHAEKRARTRTLQCETHLQRALSKKDVDYDKEYRCYRLLALSYMKQKNINSAKAYNESLQVFIESLPTIQSEA